MRRKLEQNSSYSGGVTLAREQTLLIRGGTNADQHLTGGRFRYGQRLEFEDLWSSRLVNYCSFHCSDVRLSANGIVVFPAL
jgi:hypothetical protein